ncbi:hypothetical protein KM043_012073 [Ampulex compressa]|nr:hypothetical protein KM043_012073 [Ampulex compressa]
MWGILIAGFCTVAATVGQDYEVSDIQCSSAGSATDLLTAKIKRPVGFRGAPLFADDRSANPQTDIHCQIRPDPNDPLEDNYFLKVTDFSRCGILKRNGFIHLRIWFPAFSGVVMLADQELILMCRPPEPTLLRHKAAGFAGTFPHGARVSGVVEETPGRLEYEVALYREATGNISEASGSQAVDQAVPIGTKLQLRARISPDSAWGYIKLLEVTVSPDPDQPHAQGSVVLVKDGCRNRDFASIIPHQPARYRERKNEVFLDFEAFLLSSMRERSTLWIHSQIKACMEPQDCQPDFCLDLFEPAGHGKKRKRAVQEAASSEFLPKVERLIKRFNDSTQFTKFKENIEYTVMMPDDLYNKVAAGLEGSCGSFLYVATGLGALLALSALIMCYLASRLHRLSTAVPQDKSMDELVRNRARKFCETAPGYTGRSTVQ